MKIFVALDWFVQPKLRKVQQDKQKKLFVQEKANFLMKKLNKKICGRDKKIK
jgi:hypothetical protein